MPEQALQVLPLFAGAALLAEVNPYDAAAGTLRGLPKAYAPASPPLGAGEIYRDDLVSEAHPSSTITGEAAGVDLKNPMAGMISKKFEIKVTCG